MFLRQPQGYVNASFPHHVCHLHKALYGLKQAPRAWYEMLSQALLSMGFQNSLADSSLFVLHKGSNLVYILVYVDDILITASNTKIISDLVTQLSSKFALKDLGNLHYFLGIEVHTTPKGFVLSQAKYAMDLLTKARMQDCRPCASPSSIKPASLDSQTPMSKPELYRSLVGSL